MKVRIHGKAIEFSCPHCGQELKVDADMRGEEADCPACNASLVCPQAAPAVRKPNLAKGEFKCENCAFVGLPKKKAKGSIPVTLLLCSLGILPGLIYMVAKSGFRYICPGCGYNYRTDGVV